jgi:hypothetical protein
MLQKDQWIQIHVLKAQGVSATGTLVNRDGHISQYGSTAQTLSVGGALDNTGGPLRRTQPV